MIKPMRRYQKYLYVYLKSTLPKDKTACQVPHTKTPSNEQSQKKVLRKKTEVET